MTKNVLDVSRHRRMTPLVPTFDADSIVAQGDDEKKCQCAVAFIQLTLQHLFLWLIE